MFNNRYIRICTEEEMLYSTMMGVHNNTKSRAFKNPSPVLLIYVVKLKPRNVLIPPFPFYFSAESSAETWSAVLSALNATRAVWPLVTWPRMILSASLFPISLAIKRLRGRAPNLGS